jgi:hypothetical protein
MTGSRIEGGCQCGAVRYEVTGSPILAAICHCTMCRRANAAPAVAWAMYKQEDVRFLGSEPTLYSSSSEARRGFCGACGTQISFLASFLPGLIDLTIGSLDNPESTPPTLHYSYATHLGWLESWDELPKYPELPPKAAG